MMKFLKKLFWTTNYWLQKKSLTKNKLFSTIASRGVPYRGNSFFVCTDVYANVTVPLIQVIVINISNYFCLADYRDKN